MTLATLTPQEEEREAKVRLRRAQRASQAKQEIHGQKVWATVREHPDFRKCGCGLRRGMTLAELRLLGPGCGAPNFVCPVLDKYRRLLGH